MKKKLLVIICCVFMLMQGCSLSHNENGNVEEKIFEISDFEKIKIGMTYDEVIELIGEPTYTTGSGISRDVYKLSDDCSVIFTYAGYDELLLGIEIEAFGEEFVLKNATQY